METKTQKSSQKNQQVSSPHFSDQFFLARDNAVRINQGFVVDDVLKPVMRKLCLYFSSDPLFEIEGHGKLDKGLFICGNVGTGKTLMMRAFRENYRANYMVIGTHELNDRYETEGLESIQVFFKKGQYYPGTCFDDLGSEPAPVRYMGNSLVVMEKIILHRYQSRLPFFMSHFTTNLTGEQIEAAYGSRVRSRLREMTNHIILDGADRRR